MNDTDKTPNNPIINNFLEIKKDYLHLKSDYKCLEEEVEKLKKRLANKETQRLKLINMLKDRVLQYQSKIENLQEVNNNLDTRMQEQSRLIEEQSTTLQERNQVIESQLRTIDELEKTIENLKKNNNKVNCSTNITDKEIHLIPNGNNTSFNKFSHPSFDNRPLEPKTNKKPFKTVKNSKWSNFRWTNLDISVSGKNVQIKSTDNTLNNEPEENKSAKTVRKRKLYFSDDATVDLNTEDED